MGKLDRMVAQVLPYVPRALVGRVSARYIAGETLTQALETVRQLNAEGIRATVDVLGEFVETQAEAARAQGEYEELLRALGGHPVEAQVSVKLTQLGLKLDVPTCLHYVRGLVQRAAEQDNMVTLDMEDSSCTDATLDLFSTLRRESTHVGAVLQACLRRSRSDLERLLPLQPNLRICKGIYLEPERIAYREPEAIRQSFMDLVDMLLQRGGFVGIATHDPLLLSRSQELLQQRGAGPERYEFQMLLGVREDLRQQLRSAGHPVRVYVPFGSHWYAYSMRRLKENPAIAGHIFRNLFERIA